MLSGAPLLLETRPEKYFHITKALYGFIARSKPDESLLDVPTQDGQGEEFLLPVHKSLRHVFYEAPKVAKMSTEDLDSRLKAIIELCNGGAESSVPVADLVLQCPRLLTESLDKMHFNSASLRIWLSLFNKVNQEVALPGDDEYQEFLRRNPRLLVMPQAKIARLAFVKPSLKECDRCIYDEISSLLDCNTSEFLNVVAAHGYGLALDATCTSVGHEYSAFLQRILIELHGSTFSGNSEVMEDVSDGGIKAEDAEKALCGVLSKRFKGMKVGDDAAITSLIENIMLVKDR